MAQFPILALLTAKLVLSLSDIGQEEPEFRIIGGHDCDIMDYPYIVQLKDNASDKLFCSGTLIDTETVLTAAHCVSKFVNVQGISVVSGTSYLYNDTEEKKQKIGVKNIVSLQKSFDLVLLRLTIPPSVTFYTNFVHLPERGFTKTCRSADIIGWGYTATEPFKNTLQCAKVTIIPWEDCKTMFVKEIEDEMLCTNENLKPCFGDSGGPLICRGVLIGVVNKGACTGHYPALYVKVEDFLDDLIRIKDEVTNSFPELLSQQYFILLLLFAIYFI